MKRIFYALLVSATVLTPIEIRAQDRAIGFIEDGDKFEAEPLSSLGEDVLRFSSRPARGRRGYLFEIAKPTDDVGPGRLVLLFGNPEGGWWKSGELYVELDEIQYARLASAFDSALLEGGSSERHGCTLSDGTVLVGGEDYGYLLERYVDGKLSQLRGNCGNHPNLTISLMIEGLIFRHAP